MPPLSLRDISPLNGGTPRLLWVDILLLWIPVCAGMTMWRLLSRLEALAQFFGDFGIHIWVVS